MRRFKNILFTPLDHSPTAVQRVGTLAIRNGASVTLLGVLSEPSRLQRALHRSTDFDALREAERAALDDKLRRHVPTEGGVEVATRITTGDTAITIIQEVLRNRHDLVVVAADDEDDEDQAVINRLFRKCPCPVWVIRPATTREFRFMAAINPDPAEAELNHMIVELAASLADQERDQLHLVHGWELYGENMLRHSAFMHTPADEFDALLEEEATGRLDAVHQVLLDAGLEGHDWNIHVEKGTPAQIVPGLVDEHRITTLVMGTVARTGVSGLLIGNTAERVLDQVRCSVVALKPPGYQTPVKVPGD